LPVMPKTTFRLTLQSLYFGESPRARRFRYGLIAFDILTMAIFILASAARDQWWLIPLDLVLAVVLSVELAARLYVEENRREQILTFATLADVVVIGSLLLPAFVDNLGFLRVVRALRLLRSYHLLRDLRAASPRFRLYEDVVQRTVNLGVFIFVVTSVVYVTQNDINPGIPSYIDALYFTITTLTTTGFGDITLIGPAGRVLAVIIMVVGVSLFLQLLRALFRPNKVRHECPDCGLLVHDIDAIHCKHCGRLLHIQTEGAV
jgi:voltage-gated potassium channel